MVILQACINDTFRQSLKELMCSKVSIEEKLSTSEEEKRQRYGISYDTL